MGGRPGGAWQLRGIYVGWMLGKIPVGRLLYVREAAVPAVFPGLFSRSKCQSNHIVLLADGWATS